jgi:hypothetical protein
MVFMYKKYNLLANSGWICFEQQNILSRPIFHKTMRELVKMDWVKCRQTENGIIIKKEYSLTIDGYFAAHTIFAEMVQKCQ